MNANFSRNRRTSVEIKLVLYIQEDIYFVRKLRIELEGRKPGWVFETVARRGEASVYKAQLCAQLNDTQLR